MLIEALRYAELPGVPNDVLKAVHMLAGATNSKNIVFGNDY